MFSTVTVVVMIAIDLFIIALMHGHVDRVFGDMCGIFAIMELLSLLILGERSFDAPIGMRIAFIVVNLLMLYLSRNHGISGWRRLKAVGAKAKARLAALTQKAGAMRPLRAPLPHAS